MKMFVHMFNCVEVGKNMHNGQTDLRTKYFVQTSLRVKALQIICSQFPIYFINTGINGIIHNPLIYKNKSLYKSNRKSVCTEGSH